MKFIIKYEVVKGEYENRSKEKVSYESVRLYTLTFNEKHPTWNPAVKEDSQYEQTYSCGGVRDRARKWVARDSIGVKSSGTQVPCFDVVSFPVSRLADLLGFDTVEELQASFVDCMFLHGLKVTHSENDYNTVVVESLEVSNETVLDVLNAASE